MRFHLKNHPFSSGTCHGENNPFRYFRQGIAIELLQKLLGDELAFYDALETNDSAVRILGDKTLCTIARALVKTVRNNVAIDWTMREAVRAQLRVLLKRTLRKYGYPPDREERATRTVLKQAELFGDQWVGRQAARAVHRRSGTTAISRSS